MPTCETCVFWLIETTGEPHTSTMDELRVVDLSVCDADYERLDPQPFEIRRCHSPKLREYERPERDGAATMDGSQYFSALFTGPEYGCIHHTPAA